MATVASGATAAAAQVTTPQTGVAETQTTPPVKAPAPVRGRPALPPPRIRPQRAAQRTRPRGHGSCDNNRNGCSNKLQQSEFKKTGVEQQASSAPLNTNFAGTSSRRLATPALTPVAAKCLGTAQHLDVVGCHGTVLIPMYYATACRVIQRPVLQARCVTGRMGVIYTITIVLAVLFVGPWLLASLVGLACSVSPPVGRWVQQHLFGNSMPSKGRILPQGPGS